VSGCARSAFSCAAPLACTPAVVRRSPHARGVSAKTIASSTQRGSVGHRSGFTAGVRVWGGDGVRVVRHLGVLAVPSGALLLGDPLELPSAPRIPLAADTCTIRLALVRMFGVHEVSAVRADFGQGPVHRWRKRRKGCAIDSATASVADASLLAALRDEKQRDRLTARCAAKEEATPLKAVATGIERTFL
jgi:hypothetical protein